MTAAVKYNPNYAEALMALGDTLRRSGRIEASLKPYADVVRINPRSAEARFAYALALVRLRRYRDAKAWLEESARVLPDRPELSHALARILAAAPDDTVRDGARAMTLVQELMKGNQTTVVGETMAMALAELGQFSDAVDVQKRRDRRVATGWRGPGRSPNDRQPASVRAPPGVPDAVARRRSGAYSLDVCLGVLVWSDSDGKVDPHITT